MAASTMQRQDSEWYIAASFHEPVPLSEATRVFMSKVNPYGKPPRTIQLFIRHAGRDQKRLARLSLIKSDSDVNFISPNLVELSRLRASNQHEVCGPFTINGWKVFTQGSVDLTWSLEDSSQPRTTTFLIVQSESFPFDVALSQNYAEDHDIIFD
ncbi:hypothetical protein HDK64DRAFT_46876 [Phyllosticta capitalensis]